MIYRIITGEVHTNTYIVAEEGEAIIIDPGDDFDRICSLLKENNLAPKWVLVTHGHFDHIGVVSDFQAVGAKVYISAADYKLLVENNFFIDLGFGPDGVDGFTADVELNDGDEFTVAGHSFKVVATPGHTPGGVCYVMDDEIIFSGDTLFYMSVGRTDFPYCDGAALISSLKKLFELKGDYKVLPGHGNSTTLDFERKHNPYAY